ncbi:PAS domain-containing protein [Pseudomonas sp. nanlin1]|uniref:hybrid sensor histidine kinase/response regulator n=1 Tax=Pseudomonas sp. nanlin1 TaxID=3040605 RepID=UPI00388F5C08
MSFLSESHGCQGWHGEMSERIRAFDWTPTDLGPIDSWSQSLRATVQFMLGSPVPLVMLWGRQGYMIYNDAYSLFAGARHPQLLGRAVELGWPEVAELNRQVLDTCLAGGTLSFRDKELVLLRNGEPETLWLDLNYSPVADDSGAPAGVMAIVVETTAHVVSERARQHAEAGFRAADERLQLALNTGAVLGSFVWDIPNNRVSGDERFARTFSYPLEQSTEGLPGQVASEIIHPDDRDRVDADIEATVATGCPYHTEYRIRRPDGSYLWVLASGRCEFDASGQPQRFPGVLIDIDKRKQAEEALMQLTRELEQRVSEEVLARSNAEEQLRQSRKLEAIGGLTGGVAHDFNNVLQIISGNLHLLARIEPDNDKIQRRVASAVTAVERGAKLSSQLLAFARRQPLSPVLYDLGQLHEGFDEVLQRALGETIQISVKLPAEPWSIHVDRHQLENAVLNLAINARDALGGEGTIAFEGANVVLDAVFCAGKEITPGEYVHLAVTDRGRGMPPQVLEQAFEPFFTTKPVGQGTGLGLSMVFGFVKQSGGHVEMVSEVGRGTSVHLYFPRSIDHQALAPPAVPIVPSSLDQASILVVEDDEEVRATAVDLLRSFGYRVSIAANGDEALRLLQDGAQVDLVFTDVVMPGQVKSTALAAWARARTPPIAVLFTSGHTRDLISVNHELTPDIHLLSKPYGPQTLQAMVRMVLSGRPEM